MSSVPVGALVLHLLGLGFLVLAAHAWLHRCRTGSPHGVAGVIMNVLLGALAVGEAAVIVVDEPGRVAYWSFGAALVVLVIGAVALRRRPVIHQISPRRPAPAPAAAAIPTQRTAATYTSLTSSPT